MIVESIHPPCLNSFLSAVGSAGFERRSGNAVRLPIAHPIAKGWSHDRRDYTRHFFISSPSYDHIAQYLRLCNFFSFTLQPPEAGSAHSDEGAFATQVSGREIVI
jgi:hypothetical protein